MEKKREFFLLKEHTDKEFTAFLASEEEKGWWLWKSKGNTLLFEKKKEESRVAVLTVEAKDLGEGADEAVRRRTTELKEAGWEIFSVGEMENLRDTQRHVFLYASSAAARIPEESEKARKRQRFSSVLRSVGNLGLSMIFLSFLLFALMVYEKGSLLFVFGFLPLLESLLMFFLSLAAVVNSFVALKHEEKTVGKKTYRFVDWSTQLSTYILITMLLYLMLDVLVRGF